MSHGGGDLLARLQVAEKKPPIDQDLKEGWRASRAARALAPCRCYLMRKPDESMMIVHKRVPVSHASRPTRRSPSARRTSSRPSTTRTLFVRRRFVRQGQPCIAMEHAVGGDLSAHLQSLKADGKRRASRRPRLVCPAAAHPALCARLQGIATATSP